MTDDMKHKLREKIANIVLQSKGDIFGYVGCLWAADVILKLVEGHKDD